MINTSLSTRLSQANRTSSASRKADGGDATFNYNSQDTTVFPNGTVTLHGVTQGAAPSTDKVKANDPLKPENGQYVYQEGDKREVQAQAFATVAHTVDVFGQAIGQPINWASHKQQLGVNYDHGEDFNAYYAREDTQPGAGDGGSVNFFHGKDPKTNQVIMSGDSGEVVSHETGHAILDSFRPAYFSSFTPDVAAFHEAFGDMMGICMSLQDPRVIDNVAKATGGDLKQQNIVAATGEQLGAAINDVTGQNTTGGDWVRNAINDFKWADPNGLDQNGDATHLGSEAHSFSRLWTGAFYDVVAGIQADNMKQNGGDAKAALQATGKEAVQLLANMVKGAPQGDFTYRDMANAWIAADKQFDGGKRADLITQVMTDRGILGSNPTPTPQPQPPDDGGGDDGSDDGSMMHTFTFTDKGMKPLASEVHPVTIHLDNNVPEAFKGAKVTTLVDNDGALEKDADAANRTKQSVANLIKAGRILVTTPGQKLTTKDMFDKKGEPYTGILKYNADGSKTIERVKIAS